MPIPMPTPTADYHPRRSTRRAPYAPAEARTILLAARASGLTLHAYAKRFGLDSGLLYWWQAKLAAGCTKSDQPGAKSALAFVPLVVTPPAVPAACTDNTGGIELQVAGVTVRLEPGFCDQTLRRALAVVTGGWPC